MTKKKNKILTFIFSLIPGAGEMYMGFMKQGLSLMSMFFASVMLAVWIRADVLLFVSVIIWFYSFFHVHNLRALSDEKFESEEDKLIIPFSGEQIYFNFNISNNKIRAACAIVLILVGASILWSYLLDTIARFLPYEIYYIVWDLCYDLPEVAVAILVIWLGIRLIKGKKKALEQEAQKVSEQNDQKPCEQQVCEAQEQSGAQKKQ